MSTYSTADIRKMVDDVDDAFRAALLDGDIKTVFTRERGNLVSLSKLFFNSMLKHVQNHIMRTKRENKNNAEISQAFNVNRFLWPFATQYVKAKSEGQLDHFWERAATNLATFDQKNPGCRRDSATFGHDGNAVAQASRPPTTTQEMRPPSTARQSNIEASATLAHALASKGDASATNIPPRKTVQASRPPSIPQQSNLEASTTLGHAFPSKDDASATIGPLRKTDQASRPPSNPQQLNVEASATLGHALASKGEASATIDLSSKTVQSSRPLPIP
jgi:hypothetical protein